MSEDINSIYYRQRKDAKNTNRDRADIEQLKRLVSDFRGTTPRTVINEGATTIIPGGAGLSQSEVVDIVNGIVDAMTTPQITGTNHVATGTGTVLDNTGKSYTRHRIAVTGGTYTSGTILVIASSDNSQFDTEITITVASNETFGYDFKGTYQYLNYNLSAFSAGGDDIDISLESYVGG